MQRCYRPPHPNPLPQGERGRLPWCNALRLLHPTAHPQGRGDGYRGRLRFANRPYSTQFDPIRPNSTLPIAPSVHRTRGHGHSPEGGREDPSRVQLSHLGVGARARLDAAKVATAPDCRYQIAPLTIDHEKGANRRRWISYGFIERLTMAAITQLSETRGFLCWRTLFGLGDQSMAVGAGYWQGDGVTPQGERRRGGAITLI